MELVKELMAKYRDARTLVNVLDNLGAEMKELESAIAKHEAEADKRMREMPAFKDFMEACDEVEKLNKEYENEGF